MKKLLYREIADENVSDLLNLIFSSFKKPMSSKDVWEASLFVSRYVENLDPDNPVYEIEKIMISPKELQYASRTPYSIRSVKLELIPEKEKTGILLLEEFTR